MYWIKFARIRSYELILWDALTFVPSPVHLNKQFNIFFSFFCSQQQMK